MAAVQKKLALVYEVTLSCTALYYAACCTVLYVLSIWPFMLQNAQLYQLESIICPSDSALPASGASTPLCLHPERTRWILEGLIEHDIVVLPGREILLSRLAI